VEEQDFAGPVGVLGIVESTKQTFVTTDGPRTVITGIAGMTSGENPVDPGINAAVRIAD
jgi:hypothetical protein